MHVRYSYLPQQFADPEEILDQIRKFLPSGDFTLGYPVNEFEQRFAELMGTRHAIGVGSGTDALKIPLKALGVGYGDEVITTANTFVATVGAINEVGAKPVFVDCDDTFVIDPTKIESAITDKTKALMPVHLAGYPADMPEIMKIAEKYELPVVEDACQGILASVDGGLTGSWGCAGAFSLHPLKNLNVWGDGGIIVTNDDDLADQFRLLRNHGLVNRDEIAVLGYNSRLDSLQAIVGNWLIDQAWEITNKRISNALYYDEHLRNIPSIRIPERPTNKRMVFNIYMVFAEDRDALHRHCNELGVESKIHYPVPIYRQPALSEYGFKVGDFPMTDRHADSIITFPVDEYLTTEEMDRVIEAVHSFY